MLKKALVKNVFQGQIIDEFRNPKEHRGPGTAIMAIHCYPYYVTNSYRCFYKADKGKEKSHPGVGTSSLRVWAKMFGAFKLRPQWHTADLHKIINGLKGVNRK